MNFSGVESKYIDSLTKVFTKEYFYVQARKMIEENPDTTFCVCQLDINRLTMINDMYGLGEGDRVLKVIGSTLIEIFQEVPLSVVARVHADLFVFLCPFEKKFLEQYIDILENNTRFLSGKLNVDLLLSFGVYVTKEDGVPVTSMIERANLALKSIKGNYINHVAYFDSEMREKAKEELDIVTRMNTALKNKEFVVYYQPKHSLDTEEVIGAEALVRWISPDKGIISPAKFIPIFENNGFIMKLDEYVWEETCRFISDNISKGIQIPPISVNVSRVDLYNPRLVETLVGLTRKYAIDPKMLKLEFTESAYTESMQQMLGVMERFHEYNMEIDMDDFGSGYSGLNVLKDVPVDGLKIDLRFLSKSDDEAKGRKILASVLHMAKWLGIPSIVEGVETIEQINYLKSLGCTMVQGFYYAKPMSTEDFLTYLFENNISSKLEVERPFGENMIDPDEWFDEVTSDCEPVLEMSHSYLLFDRGKDDELDIIRASDSFYEYLGGRDRDYNCCEIIHPDDLARVLGAFDSINEYSTIGKCIHRVTYNKNIVWVFMRIRLLAKYEGHKIFFVTLDDIAEEMDKQLLR